MKHILLLVKLIMQVSRTILRNVTKTQNLTMDVKNWTKAAFEWSSHFYDNCRAAVEEVEVGVVTFM